MYGNKSETHGSLHDLNTKMTISEPGVLDEPELDDGTVAVAEAVADGATCPISCAGVQKGRHPFLAQHNDLNFSTFNHNQIGYWFQFQCIGNFVERCNW